MRTVLALCRKANRQSGAQALAALANNRHVRPRTDGQARYVQAMKENDSSSRSARPAPARPISPSAWPSTCCARARSSTSCWSAAVEAGEKLGFLPGDIVAKINPYLRPLFDGLNDMMEPEQVKRYMDSDIIEVAPLAFMRGRTLNESVIILDEGQNTTIAQMKMFLTRMGNGSKIIVTGDITQIDLPRKCRSGLIDAIHRFDHLEKIAVDLPERTRHCAAPVGAKDRSRL